jgi:tRNA (guanosine-2'-O-)-methyltransferase
VPWLEPSARPVPSPDPRLTPDTVARWLGPLLSKRRRRRIERVVCTRLASVTVVLERLHDPHNGAAALRTCEAMGLYHVHVVEGEQAPFRFSRKVSQNAHKWLNIYVHDSIEDCIGYLRRAGFVCWAAVPPLLSAQASTPGARRLGSVDLTRPAALVFGNEHLGLSDEALSACEESFSVPLQGFTESLNLSVSVAVSLHSVVGGRRRLLGRVGDLPDGARDQLRAAYYALSTRHTVPIVLQRLGL